jgi:pimeloyl-ACP methyl ester carboxylesterase
MCDIEYHEGYVDAKDVRLYWREVAHKQPHGTIVFVHGDDSNCSVWRCEQWFFANLGFRTIAVDMRGFGKSSKQGPLYLPVHVVDLKSVVRKLCIETFILVGWSMGGLVSQAFTISHPKYVEKLVLVDTMPQIMASPSFPMGRTPEQEAKFMAVLEGNFEKAAIEGAARTISEKCPNVRAVRQEVRMDILATGQRIAVKQEKQIKNASVVRYLDKIRCPTLIVFGGKDEVVNPACSLFLRQSISSSQLVEIPNAGHAPFLTYKKQFEEALCRFLLEKEVCSVCV